MPCWRYHPSLTPVSARTHMSPVSMSCESMKYRAEGCYLTSDFAMAEKHELTE